MRQPRTRLRSRVSEMLFGDNNFSHRRRKSSRWAVTKTWFFGRLQPNGTGAMNGDRRRKERANAAPFAIAWFSP